MHLGADSLLALYAQQPVQKLDDQVHPVKTKASTSLSGGKKGVEDCRSFFGGYSLSRIPHGETDIPTGFLKPFVGAEPELEGGGFDRHDTAVGHRVARACDQIEENSFQFDGGRAHNSVPCCESHPQIYFRTEYAQSVASICTTTD